MPPTISNKAVNIYNITSNGFYMSWQKATDNDSPAHKLQYSAIINVGGHLVYESPWRNDINTLGYHELHPNYTYVVTLRVRDEADNIAEYNSATFTTLPIPAPTNIGYKNRYIYSWPGKTVDLGVTLSPASASYSSVQLVSMEADSHFLTGTGTYEVHDDRIEVTPRVKQGTDGKGLLVTNPAALDVNLKIPNGKTTTVTVRTKFTMSISRNSGANFFDNSIKINQNSSYSWPRSQNNKQYIRAFYGANEGGGKWLITYPQCT